MPSFVSSPYPLCRLVAKLSSGPVMQYFTSSSFSFFQSSSVVCSSTQEQCNAVSVCWWSFEKLSLSLFLSLTKDDLADEADDDAGSGSFTNVPLLFGSVQLVHQKDEISKQGRKTYSSSLYSHFIAKDTSSCNSSTLAGVVIRILVNNNLNCSDKASFTSQVVGCYDSKGIRNRPYL